MQQSCSARMHACLRDHLWGQHHEVASRRLCCPPVPKMMIRSLLSCDRVFLSSSFFVQQGLRAAHMGTSVDCDSACTMALAIHCRLATLPLCPLSGLRCKMALLL